MVDDSFTDIAIVGGGMVGLSLALLLANKHVVLDNRLGSASSSKESSQKNQPWHITVIDRFAGSDSDANVDARAYQSSFDARSTALAKSSEEILQTAGIWSVLSQHLTAIEQVHVSDKGHIGGAQLHAKEHDLAALGYVVENIWFGKVLLQAVSAENSIRLEAPAHVDDIKANARGYELALDHSGQKKQLQASLVILADGADSQLRSCLGIGVATEDYHQAAIITNVESDKAHDGVAYERFTDDGPMALLPLGESPASRVSALVWTQPEEFSDAILHLSEKDFLKQLQQRFGYRQGRFLRAGQRYSYPLKLQLAREQVRRSLVVTGNAAHFLHPVAGQGFNLALRDCAALVFALGKAESEGKTLGDPAVLQGYIDAQAWDQWGTIHLSDGLVRLFSNNQLSSSVLRNLGILGLGAVPPANHLFARQAMGYPLV